MTAHTPIWVCAYTNNQWELIENITEDSKESTFTNAMKVSSNRSISILDEGGETFKRIQCGFQINLTFDAAEDETWVIYTTKTHKFNYHGEERLAVWIVSGGAPIDGNNTFTAYHEEDFSFKLIAQEPSI